MLSRWIVSSFAAGLLLSACARVEADATPTLATLLTAPPTALAAPAADTPTAAPTMVAPTATPEPSPTPGATLKQMSTGGCCTQPFWSPNGQSIWFVDRPPNLPGGIWAIDPLTPLKATLVTEQLGLLSPDGSLIACRSGESTVIERLADGATWDVPAYGRAIVFSPDSQKIAWQIASSTENFDRRLVQVWVSDVSGDNARQVAQLVGGGLSGWLMDSTRLLVTRRESLGATPAVGILDPATEVFTPLASGDFLRAVSLSPDGRRLVYTQQFSGDAQRDGIWIQSLEGGESLKVSVFGSYRWGSDGGLIVIPLELNAPAQRVLRVDATTGDVKALTDPAVTPLQILDGDWTLSPDGRRLAYVNVADRNIWLLELP